jgi:hypothetical protein
MLSGTHTPVICISEIPEAVRLHIQFMHMVLPLTRHPHICQTLDYFLQKYLDSEDEDMISDEIAFITSKDMSAITSGATRPAKAFTSPFLGETIQQVGDWFMANISPIDDGFTGLSFLVMDSQTVEDNTCLVVCTLLDEVETVRCEFDVAQPQILSIEFGSEGMRDARRAPFMDTGEVMTKELYEICLEGRLDVVDGKLKVEEK